MSWRLSSKVENIIDKGITHVPWEGDEIDTISIRDRIIEYYEGVMKGLITFITKEYIHTSKGYKHSGTGVIHSREEIIEKFLNENL